MEAVFERRRDPEVRACPAQAQKRSGFASLLACTSRPSPVTTSAESRLSIVRPNLQLQPAHPAAQRQPRPPVCEIDAHRADETEGLRLVVEVAEKRSRRSDACDRGAPGSTRTPRMRERSITIPSSQVEKPGMLCPPLRTAIGSSSVRAKRDRCDDVGGTCRPDDQRRPAVDHPVPDRARGLIRRILREDHLAANASAKARLVVS